MGDVATRAMARAGLYRLQALAFSHPEPDFYPRLQSGEFQRPER